MKDVLTLQVHEVWMEAVGIRAFKLAGLDNESLPPYEPGSHIDLHIGPNLVRQYSLCNGPDQYDHYLIAVKREVESRGGSEYLHQCVERGSRLAVGLPRSNFSLRTDVEKSLLVAGGIGITPLLSMARHLRARNRAFELHYFTRSMEHAAFRSLLTTPSFTGSVAFRCETDVDRVRLMLEHLLVRRPSQAHLYLCGPAPFMTLVQQAASSDWPPETIHLEYFAADPTTKREVAREFVIKLARSNREFVIPPTKSIVQVLTENDIWIDFSCEAGICGTCIANVLEGTPDHRDLVLSVEERAAGRKIALCVSRAKSDVLVIDL